MIKKGVSTMYVYVCIIKEKKPNKSTKTFNSIQGKEKNTVEQG